MELAHRSHELRGGFCSVWQTAHFHGSKHCPTARAIQLISHKPPVQSVIMAWTPCRTLCRRNGLSLRHFGQVKLCSSLIVVWLEAFAEEGLMRDKQFVG